MGNGIPPYWPCLARGVHPPSYECRVPMQVSGP
jgi:hypothetical protein